MRRTSKEDKVKAAKEKTATTGTGTSDLTNKQKGQESDRRVSSR